jgi:hypothetical protein
MAISEILPWGAFPDKARKGNAFLGKLSAIPPYTRARGREGKHSRFLPPWIPPASLACARRVAGSYTVLNSALFTPVGVNPQAAKHAPCLGAAESPPPPEVQALRDYPRERRSEKKWKRCGCAR